MRCLLVVNSLLGGGAERVMSWLASGLADRGHAVTLVVRQPAETDHYQCDSRVRIVRHVRPPLLPTGSRRNLRPARIARVAANRATIGRDYYTFALLLRRLARDSDVVVSFIDSMNVQVLLSVVGIGTPVVVSERIDPAFHELGRLERVRPALYRRAASVVVQSQGIADRVVRDWRLRRVAVIPNAPAIDSDGGIAVEERPRRVLAVGRLHPQKNHGLLLSAWAGSEAERAGWRLDLLGEGRERPALESQAQLAGISDSVGLPGMSSDMAAEYERAPIFVLPSRYEGFPNALVEAMTCGCACIATDCPGATAEILERGAAGVLVPTDDVAALREALDCLVTDVHERIRLSRRARLRSQDFLPEEVMRQWEAVLEDAAKCGNLHGERAVPTGQL